MTMATWTFCTYFDSHYLSRGLALYRSLSRHCADFHLWVLCLDEESYAFLARARLPHVSLLRLEELESAFPELSVAKQNRSRIEYYFTLTPCLPLYLLDTFPSLTAITYLDADLYFFSSPAPILSQLENASVVITAHRFPPQHRFREVVGKFNVGWLSFRNDADGIACLSWWRDRCVEWCYDRVEGNRYGDQKYLDQWPTLFRNVRVADHKGANTAPWNVANYCVTRDADGVARVDEAPLLFFHFQALKQVRSWLYRPNLAGYGIRDLRAVRRIIYAPYINDLRRIQGECRLDFARNLSPGIRRRSQQAPLPQRAVTWAVEAARFLRDAALGRYIVVIRGKVL
jgi:hypothetical protein